MVGLTSHAYWSDGVLIESKALFQRMSSHVLVEDITPGKIQNATVVLVFGDEPRRKTIQAHQYSMKTLMFKETFVIF